MNISINYSIVRNFSYFDFWFLFSRQIFSLKMSLLRDLPCGPVVKTPCLSARDTLVQLLLVGKLKICQPHSETKNNKKIPPDFHSRISFQINNLYKAAMKLGSNIKATNRNTGIKLEINNNNVTIKLQIFGISARYF